MGRKKWNKLTQKKKEELSNKIVEKMDELTNLRDTFEQEFFFFDVLNNEIEDCFECDLECVSCSNEDRAMCMQNFRITNLYILKKVKMYEEGMYKFMFGIENWCKLFLNLLKKEIKSKDFDLPEEEIEDYEKIVKPSFEKQEIKIKDPCLDFYI